MAETLAQLRSRYVWNAKSLRYQNRAGRFVSQRAIKQGLNTYVRRTQREIEALARDVSTGRIDVAEWQRQTANTIKSAHLAARAAAKGGWAQLDARDYGAIGADLRKQYKFLRRFAADIVSFKLTPKAIVARAGMYAQTGRTAFERGRFDDHQRLAGTGVRVEMKNVLGDAEHCTAGNGRPGCAEESAKGWVEVGTLSLPGERRCLGHCYCRLAYRTR